MSCLRLRKKPAILAAFLGSTVIFRDAPQKSYPSNFVFGAEVLGSEKNRKKSEKHTDHNSVGTKPDDDGEDEFYYYGVDANGDSHEIGEYVDDTGQRSAENEEDRNNNHSGYDEEEIDNIWGEKDDQDAEEIEKIYADQNAEDEEIPEDPHANSEEHSESFDLADLLESTKTISREPPELKPGEIVRWKEFKPNHVIGHKFGRSHEEKDYNRERRKRLKSVTGSTEDGSVDADDETPLIERHPEYFKLSGMTRSSCSLWPKKNKILKNKNDQKTTVSTCRPESLKILHPRRLRF